MIRRLTSLHFGDCRTQILSLCKETANLRHALELLRQENNRVMTENHTLKATYDYQIAYIESQLETYKKSEEENKQIDIIVEPNKAIKIRKITSKKKSGRSKKDETKRKKDTH